MRKLTINRLTAEEMSESNKVLIVNRDNVPLAFVSLSDSWWKYDVEPVGTHRKQPCNSLTEVKEWVRLNRGLL